MVVIGEHDILTIMGVHAHGSEYFGSLCDNVSAPINPPAVAIPLVAAEIEVERDEKLHEEEVAGGEHDGVITVQVEIPQKIYVEGLELKATSSVYDLRRICKCFGINQSGSKSKMYERIVHCHVVALRRQALEMYEQQYRAEVIDPHESSVPVKQPSLRARRPHELTHLPFRQWCPHCVACKSRPDHQQRSDPGEVAARENPTIQIDLMFGISGGPILIMVNV